jgi:hypothetical protein
MPLKEQFGKKAWGVMYCPKYLSTPRYCRCVESIYDYENLREFEAKIQRLNMNTCIRGLCRTDLNKKNRKIGLKDGFH